MKTWLVSLFVTLQSQSRLQLLKDQGSQEIRRTRLSMMLTLRRLSPGASLTRAAQRQRPRPLPQATRLLLSPSQAALTGAPALNPSLQRLRSPPQMRLIQSLSRLVQRNKTLPTTRPCTLASWRLIGDWSRSSSPPWSVRSVWRPSEVHQSNVAAMVTLFATRVSHGPRTAPPVACPWG